MAELLYRVAKVAKLTEEDRDDGLLLTPGKWGHGELGPGDLIELHRPDGIIITARVRGVRHPSKEIEVGNLLSFELVPVGTEVRVLKTPPEAVPPSLARFQSIIKREEKQKLEMPQYLQYSFRRGSDGMSRRFFEDNSGPVIVWFPMHPLLERVRCWVEKLKSGNPDRHRAPASDKLVEACLANLRWLEEAADGDEERVIWNREEPDIVAPVARRLVGRLEFGWLSCPVCSSDYEPAQLKFHRWRTGGWMAETAGSTLQCPKDHPLFEFILWIS